ncbi:flagellin [Okibacterium sp. HSC-33S16]|uniref:flagellin N-terminal helical domain-containing protein n=1 Tax=Okibacterium sp. HSC-33S16 TaxID=2910965 RepID=UPI0020A071A4|nr:flagellin [Okibacterium sp. HSC-33S16]MCP2032918.1 flagellin [Okibacterium sp. HSC-33S16]
MGMQINTNISALNSYRNLSNTQNDLSKSLEKLSSGLRINRAADDAAGLAISEGLRSQVGGLKVAARNAQDGISVIQTAEGALTETHSILQRLRDLAVQAGNDSNNAESRTAIKVESDQLVSELDRLSTSSNFNGIDLLKGDVGNGTAKLSFQIGANGTKDNQIDVDLSKANVSSIASALSGGAIGAPAATFSLPTDAAASTIAAGAATFSAVHANGTTTAVSVNITAIPAGGGVQGAVDQLNKDAAFSASFNAEVVKDANGAGVGIAVTAKDGSVIDLGASGFASGLTVEAAGASVTGGLKFDTAANAKAAIIELDKHITSVSAARADLGAVQNRFESTINSLNVSSENLAAAESRIRDTDMASEMVNYTRANILSQAGTAMLAQANQSNQGVLQLLG